MAVRASGQKLFAWGSEHGTFLLGSVTLVFTTVGGAIAATKYVDQLKMHVQQLEKDLEHERERTDLIREALEQRTDLQVKNQLFDILHHADYEAAARLLRRSETSPAAPPSTD